MSVRLEWTQIERIGSRLLKHRVIDARSGCWSNRGRLHRYRTLRIGGEYVGVHQAALWAWKGLRTYGSRTLVPMHSCDNAGCFNPEHLSVGTQRQNVEDSLAKGRRPRKGQQLTCGKGHAYTEENTYWYLGHQRCRVCNATRERQYRLRQKGLI